MFGRAALVAARAARDEGARVRYGPPMRAIRVHAPGEPDVLQLEGVPDPSPGPGEVLVRVEAAGVNFIEIYQRSGQYPLPMPMTPGAEGAGVVVAIGDGVTHVTVGDRVASVNLSGAYAELACAAATRVVKVPDGVSTRQAAAAMLQGLTAHYLAVSTRPLGPGDTCLVHAAAGGVGLLLTQIAKRRGARVIGTVSTADKERLAREAGADEIIRYREQDFVAQAKRLTAGVGVDVVYDGIGKTTFEGGLQCLRPRGMMVLFGQASGAVPLLDPQILNRGGSLFLTRPGLPHYIATPEELAWRAGEVLSWVADGSLRLHVHRELPLAEAAEAHRMLGAGSTAGKLLLLPSPSA